MPTPSRYWREIPQRYRLEAGRCTKCGYVAFPPRLVCPVCQNRKFETIILPDTGKILTWTVIRVPPHPFADQAPYSMAIVELENGVRLMGQVVDCEDEGLVSGLKVKIEFRKIYQEGESGVIYYGYKFVPA